MTITELATRIEHRLAEVRDEINRLQAADEALAATDTSAATVASVPERHRPRRNLQAASVPDPSEPGPHRAADRRGPKSAIVLALARELDAGLRNRP